MSESPLNLLYVVCHDLGRHLGCYGTGVYSPNLDRLAERGTLFERAFCSSAVCSPSRGCAMTGLHAHENGIMGLTHFGWEYFPGTDTLVDHLKRGGYETVHTGLSHEGNEGEGGYDINTEQSWAARETENAFSDAIDYLERRQQALRSGRDVKPFYLNVGTQDVHQVTWCRDTFEDGSPRRIRSVYGGPRDPATVHLPGWVPDLPEFRDLFARFESSIAYFDSQIPRLLEALERTGHGDDTLVVFTTDHGMYGQTAKGSLRDQGLETALITLLPPSMQANAPERISHLIQHLDFVPTFLDMAGLEFPGNLPGKSFWPLLTGGEYEPHRTLVAEWNFGSTEDTFDPSRTLRRDGWRYIRNFGERPPRYWTPEELAEGYSPSDDIWRAPWPDPKGVEAKEELYDLENDPHGFHNLAPEMEGSELLRSYREELADWMEMRRDYLPCGEMPKITGRPGFGVLDR